MSVRTATGGKADWSANGATYVNIPEVREWKLRIGNESKQYASSSTGGGKRRIAGAEDFDGTIGLYHDAANRVDAMGIKAGATGYLKLWEDSGDFYIAPAYIGDVNVNVGIEANDIIDGSITFSRDGPLVYPT